MAELKRPTEAEAELRSAVADDPADPDLLRALAHQLQANSKYAEARQTLTRIKQLPSAKPAPPISFATAG